MSEFIMMVGMIGSGKSTEAKCYEEDKGYIVHSSDAMREELFGDVTDQSNNPKVFSELQKRIIKDLKDGKNVIMDSTNISYKRRMEFLRKIKDIKCTKKAILMATPFNDCVDRDKKRDRTVGAGVVKNMYLNFNIPQYFEGWDEIEIVFPDDFDREGSTGERVIDRTSQLSKIKQNNTHHTLSIGSHCDRASKNLINIIESLKERGNTMEDLSAAEYGQIGLALSLHDCAKHATASFYNSKGHLTENCSYYGHENPSAYDAMFPLLNLDTDSILDVVKYIQFHMLPLTGLNTKKSVEKFEKLLGENFVANLIIMHDCDIRAK